MCKSVFVSACVSGGRNGQCMPDAPTSHPPPQWYRQLSVCVRRCSERFPIPRWRWQEINKNCSLQLEIQLIKDGLMSDSKYTIIRNVTGIKGLMANKLCYMGKRLTVVINWTLCRSLSLLQIDAVSLFLLYLVEMICSGLQIIYNTDEVNRTPPRLSVGST